MLKVCHRLPFGPPTRKNLLFENVRELLIGELIRFPFLTRRIELRKSLLFGGGKSLEFGENVVRLRYKENGQKYQRCAEYDHRSVAAVCGVRLLCGWSHEEQTEKETGAEAANVSRHVHFRPGQSKEEVVSNEYERTFAQSSERFCGDHFSMEQQE